MEVWDIHDDREDRRWYPDLFEGQIREFGKTGGVTTPTSLCSTDHSPIPFLFGNLTTSYNISPHRPSSRM
jgi:hypothetical protein